MDSTWGRNYGINLLIFIHSITFTPIIGLTFMAWTLLLRDFEYSFLELQRMLENKKLSNLEQENMIPLLKETVERGWATLKAFTSDYRSTHLMRPYSLRDAVQSQNFPLKPGDDLNLKFDERPFPEMEWEIREIVYPAFCDLYIYLKSAEKQLQKT